MGLTCAALNIMLRTYKWQLLLWNQGIRLSFGTLHALSYQALFLNNFAPGSLGGDAFRVYKTMHNGKGKGRAVAAVIMERLTGISILLGIVVVSSGAGLFFWETGLSRTVLEIVFAVGATILIGGYAAYKVAMTGLMSAQFLGSGGLVGRFSAALESIQTYASDRDTIRRCLLLSSAYQVVLSIGMFFFSLAGGVEISPLHFFLVVSIVSLAISLPISINGIGLQEGAFYFYLQSCGVEPVSALQIALLPRIGMLLFSLIGASLLVYDWVTHKRPARTISLQ
jgi:uncharacterized protein (TIRG00374 family)